MKGGEKEYFININQSGVTPIGTVPAIKAMPICLLFTN